ncbi:class I SAM-dependent methyltransferase [Agrobacterium pusense]|uniref:class I SAM-dependent methyltransferase n=1 Tax=Agrobacterium pusense TaxID=648995 RepID=UPI001C6E8A91|nr:class I SAM-dependent methyltransferase [Agrobacterium pusense]MBW9069913.1 class I SAM-dependent methyltransferase [Agrobacterium pusense]MBW9084848.1 class I SAM-dependent methyltransferase [Agrobacterium pusense]MBW9125278.1 class I SAM-dependent methyltransferase [Agrobacterium pusense]MBW9137693.1 class I SAM-dependent methyltransferase [Agrobacterium pusense]
MDNTVKNAWRRAPRLNEFSDFFEKTASGVEGAPDYGAPAASTALLQFDLDCLTFADTHRRLWGKFEHHYFASIPYRLEEECRIAAAAFRFCLRAWAEEGRPAALYTLGAGAGSLSRSLAKLGDGRIITLNCSPTVANRVCFYEKRGSEYAQFFEGPFFELDAERIATDRDLEPFRQGFDVLIEDTTFQMYESDRDNQIRFVAGSLKPTGVLVQVQKLRHRDPLIYAKRERQKDEVFKSRFFSPSQISEKKREILNTMIDFQVDMETTSAALGLSFRYSMVTWNSGNFYTIVSSNSRRSMIDFVTSLLRPAIPADFCNERLPLTIVDDANEPLPKNHRWRAPQSVTPIKAQLPGTGGN